MPLIKRPALANERVQCNPAGLAHELKDRRQVSIDDATHDIWSEQPNGCGRALRSLIDR